MGYACEREKLEWEMKRKKRDSRSEREGVRERERLLITNVFSETLMASCVLE